MKKKKDVIPLESFVKKCFYELSPADPLMNNWHISLLCKILERVYLGEIKRLIVCMPPRYLKSICISTAFPAWVMGASPHKKIIVASYAMLLAEKLSIDTKTLMDSDWYKLLFPDSVWHKSVRSKRKFANTVGGFRFATSINGSLTGEGADILIADDPQKPLDVLNKKYRDKTYSWLLNTFFSRLNNKKKGAIIIVMQRLHDDDIVGRLLKDKNCNALMQECNDWSILNLVAIAKKDEIFRSEGEVLNGKTEDIKMIEKIKNSMGNYYFNAQYQQSPSNLQKGFLRKSNICFVNTNFHSILKNGIFVSVDTAYKCGAENDYTAISLWVEMENSIMLFDVILEKMEFGDVLKKLESLFQKYNIHKMLIEDKGSGMSIIQALRKKFSAKIESIVPVKSKEVRFMSVVSYFESGDVVVNYNVREDVILQLLEFPYGKHDDAVDAISQFIFWYFNAKKTIEIQPRIRNI